MEDSGSLRILPVGDITGDFFIPDFSVGTDGLPVRSVNSWTISGRAMERPTTCNRW